MSDATIFWLTAAGMLALFYGLGFLIYVFSMRRMEYSLEKHLKAREEKLQKDLQRLDEALEQWLLTLELPQLAEQTKREEVARQLSTVLIERLMRSPCPMRHPKIHRPPQQSPTPSRQ